MTACVDRKDFQYWNKDVFIHTKLALWNTGSGEKNTMYFLRVIDIAVFVFAGVHHFRVGTSDMQLEA